MGTMGFDFLANAAAARSSAPSQIKASFVLSAAERSWRTLPFIPLFAAESPVAAEEAEDGVCVAGRALEGRVVGTEAAHQT